MVNKQFLNSSVRFTGMTISSITFPSSSVLFFFFQVSLLKQNPEWPKKPSTSPFSLLHCRIGHTEPWASPQDTHNTPHESKEGTCGFPHRPSALFYDKTELSVKQNSKWHGDTGCTKPTCLLSPIAIDAIAQLLVDPHSPHNSHVSQFPHRESHICCPWAMDLLSLSLSHITSSCRWQCWDFSP